MINLVIISKQSLLSLSQFYLMAAQALGEINHSFFTSCLYAITWYWHELVRTCQFSVTKTTWTAFPRRDGRSRGDSSPQAQTVLGLTWTAARQRFEPLTAGLIRCGHRMSIHLFDLFQQQVLKKIWRKVISHYFKLCLYNYVYNKLTSVMSAVKLQSDRKMTHLTFSTSNESN